MLVADATNKSEQIRGEGDATRNQIFADAFNKDPDFFAFYRSMQAYESGLKPTDTRFLLKPDTTSSASSTIRPASRARRRRAAGRAGALTSRRRHV